MALTKSFKEEVLKGVHNLGADVIKVALYTASATIDESTTVYSATNEITATGYTAGGATLVNPTFTADSSSIIADFDDCTYNNCNIVARKLLVYNASKGNKAIAFYDNGTDIGLVGSGSFVLAMPTGLIKVV